MTREGLKEKQIMENSIKVGRVRTRAVRSTGKAQPEGRLGRFQVETGKQTALSNPLGVIVTETAKRVKLQSGLVY